MLCGGALCLLTLCTVTSSLEAQVPSTPIEASVEALRSRFPGQIVVGFEELFETRPDTEPVVDLGPPNSSLQEALQRIRSQNPRYKIDLLPQGLAHVYPRYGIADPPGLLDLRLAEFFLPPDDCVAQQFLYMESPMKRFSYTPELGAYLWEHKVAWYRAHGKEVGGFVGDFMGDCEPAHHRHEPIYRDITLREALNLMAIHSLQAANGSPPPGRPLFRPKPISWKYRFRQAPDADTGLGGVPVFQTF
jgi:hypothetical protein